VRALDATAIVAAQLKRKPVRRTSLSDDFYTEDQMIRVLILAAATLIMLAGAVLDPGLRFLYLLLALVGLVGTFKSYRSSRARHA